LLPYFFKPQIDVILINNSLAVRRGVASGELHQKIKKEALCANRKSTAVAAYIAKDSCTRSRLKSFFCYA
jgi:hypothetical protein